MTATQIAIWALIVAAGTLLVYLGQLVVLILIYFRVIRETDRNAEIRRREIEKAGGMMQEQGKDMVQRMNGVAKRNTLGFAIMGACVAGLWLVLRTEIHKFERITKHDK